MGGRAPPAGSTTLAGGPREYSGMAPIPNPENLPLDERRRIYGNRYDHLSYRPLDGGRVHAGSAPTSALRTRRLPDGRLEISNRPIANPEDMTPAERRRVYGKRYAPRPSSAPRRWAPSRPAAKRSVAAAPAPRPAPVAKAPAPRPAAPPPKVATRPAPPPAKVAPPPAPIAKAPPPPAPALKAPAPPPVVAKAPAPAVDPKMAALSAKVAPEAIRGATLTVPDTLAKGEESKVTLALPVSLLDIIQREAANLGLTKAARKAEVSATLTGEGYAITPNGAQTQALKKGEAATFDWQVKPGDGEKTPLRATVDGALKGEAGPARTFSIATLEQRVAEAVETAESQAKKLGFNLDKLAIPGLKPITIGNQVIPPGALTAIIIAFVLLLALLGMAQASAARRARNERRRKFRTMTDYGRAENEPEPAHQPVNPMVAAAGGAAAGAAAAMTFGTDDDHKDEGHAEASHGEQAAHEEHAPAADHGHAPHDDQVHDAHADPGTDAHGHQDPAAHANPYPVASPLAQDDHHAVADGEAADAPPTSHGEHDHDGQTDADHDDSHQAAAHDDHPAPHHHREPEHA